MCLDSPRIEMHVVILKIGLMWAAGSISLTLIMFMRQL